MKIKAILIVIAGLISFQCFSQSNEDSEAVDEILDLEQKVIPPSNDDKIHMRAQVMPVMPGCEKLSRDEAQSCLEKSLITHITKNVVFPKDENGHERKDVSGTVYVEFYVNKEGVVSKPKVVRGIHPDFDKAAIDAVMSLPKMIPGQIYEKAVNVGFTVPVRFVIK